MPAGINLRNKHPGLTLEGVTKSYRQWALETGLSESVVWSRVNVLKWTDPQKILSRTRFWANPELASKMSIERRGAGNPMWKGGVSVRQRKEYSQQWRRDNESHVRDREYQKRFGITLEDYDRLMVRQNGLCAICGKTCSRGRLAVDHCHKTGRVRGLLCRKCNIILGNIGDNINWIKKAEVYLACQK